MTTTRHHDRTHRLAGVLLALVVPVAAAACAGDDGPAAPTTAGGVTGPVVVDARSLAGTTVQITQGHLIDIRVGSTDVAAWTATVADEAIVEFVPGRVDGATFDPGLHALAPGATAVTLTGPDRGTTVDFTVDVRPA
jgi:hypothetical protein